MIKNTDKYKLRKLTVGLVSVCAGLLFASNQQRFVKADALDNQNGNNNDDSTQQTNTAKQTTNTVGQNEDKTVNSIKGALNKTDNNQQTPQVEAPKPSVKVSYNNQAKNTTAQKIANTVQTRSAQQNDKGGQILNDLASQNRKSIYQNQQEAATANKPQQITTNQNVVNNNVNNKVETANNSNAKVQTALNVPKQSKKAPALNAKQLKASLASNNVQSGYKYSNGKITANGISYDVTFATADDANQASGAILYHDSENDIITPKFVNSGSDLVYNGQVVGHADINNWRINGSPFAEGLTNITLHVNIAGRFDDYSAYTNQTDNQLYISLSAYDAITNSPVAKNQLIPVNPSTVVPYSTVHKGDNVVYGDKTNDPIASASANQSKWAQADNISISRDGLKYNIDDTWNSNTTGFSGSTATPGGSNVSQSSKNALHLQLSTGVPASLWSNFLPASGVPVVITIPHNIDWIVSDQYVIGSDGISREKLKLNDNNASQIGQALANNFTREIMQNYSKKASYTTIVDGSAPQAEDSTGKHALYQAVINTSAYEDLTDNDFNVSVKANYNKANNMDVYTVVLTKKDSDPWYAYGSSQPSMLQFKPGTDMYNKYVADNGSNYKGDDFYLQLPAPDTSNFTANDLSSSNDVLIRNDLNDLKKIYLPSTANKVFNELKGITMQYVGHSAHFLPSSDVLVDISHPGMNIVTAEVGQTGTGSVELVDDQTGTVYFTSPVKGTVGQMTNVDSTAINNALTNQSLTLDDGYTVPTRVLVNKKNMEPIQLLVHSNMTYAGRIKAYDGTSKTNLGTIYNMDSDEAKDLASQINSGTLNSSSLDGWNGYAQELENGNSNINWNNYNLTSVANTSSTSDGKNNLVVTFTFTHKTTPVSTSKTITRHIVINEPNGEQIKHDQTATFNHVGNKDLVTNNIAYTNWSPANSILNAVTLPVFAGYTASGNIPKVTATPDSKDSTIVINYNPDPRKATYEFYDDVDKKQVGNTITVNGVTNQKGVKTGLALPANYVLANGQSIPISIDFGTSDPSLVIIHLVHAKKVYDPNKATASENNNAKNTKDNGNSHDTIYNETHKTITRHVTITSPSQNVTKQDQAVNFTRTATHDLVDNTWTLGSWSNDGVWKAINVPVIDGYTASGDVPQVTVTPDMHNQNLNITYKGNPVSMNVIYKYDPSAYLQNGGSKVIASVPINGLVGQTEDLTSYYSLPNKFIPAGWQINKGDEAKSYTFKPKDNNDVVIYISHILSPLANDTKDVTRTVIITNPDGKSSQTKQTVSFTRKAYKDEVTGNTVYDKWDKPYDIWQAVNVPDIPGYASAGSAPQQTVTPKDSDLTIQITYKAKTESFSVNYVDPATGKVITSTPVSGKTDSNTPINYQAPDHWVITPGQKLPKSVTIKGTGNSDINVNIQHKLDNVDISREDYDNTHRKITRTVNIYLPNQKQPDKNLSKQQTFIFTRPAQKDEVTGQYIYGNWSNNGQYTFTAVNAPQETGYVINGSANAETITPNSKDEVININYIAGGQTNSYIFQDEDENNKQVGSAHQFAGKTDETYSFIKDGKNIIVVPANYDLDGSLPTSYTFKPSGNQPLVIKLKHHIIKSTDPEWNPNDVNPDTGKKLKDEAQKIIRLTVNVTNVDGNKTSKTYIVTFTRPGTKDAVTGKITWNNWNENSLTFPAVPITAVDGYTAIYNKDGGQDKIVPNNQLPEQTVTPLDSDIVINAGYKANKKSITINFVDDDNKGANVLSTTKNGVTNQHIALGLTVPNHYVLSNGQTLPTSYTFKANGNDPITIHLSHKIDKNLTQNQIPNGAKNSDGSKTTKDDFSKAIKRTITAILPDKTVKDLSQTTTLTRTGNYDEVTGIMTYNLWSTSHFDKVTAPVVNGYTASQPVVPAVGVVDESFKDPHIVITYKAIPTPSEPTDNTPSQPTIIEPTGKTIDVDIPTSITVKMPKFDVKINGGKLSIINNKATRSSFRDTKQAPREVIGQANKITNISKQTFVEAPNKQGKAIINDLVKQMPSTQTVKAASINKSAQTNKSQVKLPQTGESQDKVLAVIAGALASAASLTALVGSRRKKGDI